MPPGSEIAGGEGRIPADLTDVFPLRKYDLLRCLRQQGQGYVDGLFRLWRMTDLPVLLKLPIIIEESVLLVLYYMRLYVY